MIRDKLPTLFDGEDRGVSPVIAVAFLILVAIGFVVALQSGVGGIVSDIEQPPQATIGTSVDADGDLNLVVQDASNTNNVTVTTHSTSTSFPDSGDMVGETATIDSGNLDGGDTVVVVAESPSGSSATVLDYTYQG